MFCSSCGKAIPPDSDFCPECGKAVPARPKPSRSSPLAWLSLAALAGVMVLGLVDISAEGSYCGSPFSPASFNSDDPCISAIWIRRVVIIVVGLAAVIGLVYGRRRPPPVRTDR